MSPFYLGKHEITEAQWEALGGDPATPGSEHRPVTNITWYDAVGFCNKLSQAESLEPAYSIINEGSPWNGVFPVVTSSVVTLDPSKNGYRLPTESEWMWAAMGATRSKGYSGGVFSTGYLKAYAGDDPSTVTDDGALGDYAWFSGNSEDASHDIGGKLPNELGLYDMTGNAEEWCQDYYATLPTNAVRNYAGPTSGTLKGLKGGRYDLGSINCVINDRVWSAQPDNIAVNRGFRVARNGQPLYTIQYDLNGIEGTLPTDPNRYDSSMQATLSSGGSARLFGSPPLSWNSAANGSGTSAALGAAVSMASGSKTLYAIWAPFVTVDLDGKTFYTTAAVSPPWTTAVEANPHETSLRSGAIGANESTIVEYTFINTNSGNQRLDYLQFSTRISSTASVGTLEVEFFLDGNSISPNPQTMTWSGDNPWSPSPIQYNFSHPISYMLPLTIRWTYSRNDGTNESPDDAAWIDDISVTVTSAIS